MKKLLLLLGILFSISFFAQNPMLYSYTWQISKIFYAGTEYPIPNPTIIPEVHKNTTTISSSEIKTQLFNTSTAAISSTSNSQITISEMGGTLSQSPNPDFDTFESNYRNIFSLAPTPKVFDYTITNFGNGTYQLLLTDTNTGNKVYYTATNLSAKTPENKKLNIYPNPASDFIFLKNIKPNSSVKIIDTLGKVVMSKKITEDFIEIKSLPKGTYFLEIEGLKTLKFIKN